MSLLMPDTDTLKTQQIAIPPSPDAASVRLNDVFQRILPGYQQQINKGNIIIRCEAMPVVEANEQELYKLFENVFFILFDNDTFNTRHFLHIDCLRQKDNGILDLTTNRVFEIQFNSNRNYDSVWTEANRARLDECYKILDRYNGKLILNPLRSNGCSFIVSLPGKLS